jgi:hypothetical protein
LLFHISNISTLWLTHLGARFCWILIYILSVGDFSIFM